MAEQSIFWTTGSTGDGASPYTQAQIIDWLRRTFVNAPASEGVLKGYANELAPSGTASPVAIATGAAMVYGFPYESTAIVNVTIPTPSIGTTGHRIVLRANWTAQTVRIALLSSSDGVPAIPAVTQNAGTTWEISIATLTITTGGAITLTDTRGFVHANVKVATANIDDNAITNAKMADNAVNTAEIANDAVDDTKAGNRVPQLYRRQGGSATVWVTSGLTNYTPTMVRMQCGATPCNGATALTFPVAFSNTPLVVATVNNNSRLVAVTSVSASGCTLTVKDLAGVDAGADVSWLAIGPE